MRFTTNARESVSTLAVLVKLGILLLATVSRCFASDSGAPNLTLWYDKPAKNWELETLPIGDGRLGAKIFGGVEREHIQFNEHSLWIGDENDAGSYQAFGDVFIEFGHSGSLLSAECASGQPIPATWFKRPVKAGN